MLQGFVFRRNKNSKVVHCNFEAAFTKVVVVDIASHQHEETDLETIFVTSRYKILLSHIGDEFFFVLLANHLVVTCGNQGSQYPENELKLAIAQVPRNQKCKRNQRKK
jgi:hypothetical protein